MIKKINFREKEYSITINNKSDTTIIFLHGFCFDQTVWADMLSYFKDYCTITFDHSGMGESDIHENHSIDLMAELLKTIIDNLDFKQYFIVGHSMGGYIACNFATKYSEKINGITILNSHPFEDTPEKKENRKKAIQFIENNGTSPFLKQMIPSLFSKDFTDKNPSIIQKLLEKAFAFKKEGIIGCQNAMINRPDSSKCFNNNIGWQVIYGKYDQTVTADLSIGQALLPDMVDIICLFDTAHMSMIEAPQNTANAIIQFIQNTIR